MRTYRYFFAKLCSARLNYVMFVTGIEDMRPPNEPWVEYNKIRSPAKGGPMGQFVEKGVEVCFESIALFRVAGRPFTILHGLKQLDIFDTFVHKGHDVINCLRTAPLRYPIRTKFDKRCLLG